MRPTMMKAIIKPSQAPGAVYTDVPVPELRPGHVLVKILAASICGTDVHIYEWNEWAQARIKPPMVFGHEFAGEVLGVGENVQGIEVGDLIAGETHIPCGTCYQCRTGLQHVCRDMAILGVHTPGVFSEYAVVHQACAWVLPKGTPADIGAVYEPVGVAAHAVLAEDVAGKTVAVFGCGPIGLFAVAISRACGASKVIACDISQERLNMAEQMGATSIIPARDADPVKAIFDITRGVGLDVGIELSGSPVALDQLLKSMTRGGRLSAAGLPSKRVEINLVDDVIYKELRIYGVTGRVMYNTWYRVSALIENGVVDPAPVITHRLPMSKIDEGMQIAKSGSAGKVILYP